MKPDAGWLPLHVGISTHAMSDSLVVRLFVPPDNYLPYNPVSRYSDTDSVYVRLFCQWAIYNDKAPAAPIWVHEGVFELDYQHLTNGSAFGYERCRIAMPCIRDVQQTLWVRVYDNWGHMGGLVVSLPDWPSGLAGWPQGTPLLLPPLPIYVVDEPMSFAVPAELQALYGDTLPAPSLSALANNPKQFNLSFKASDPLSLPVDETFTPSHARPYRLRLLFGTGAQEHTLLVAPLYLTQPQSAGLNLLPLTYLASNSKMKKMLKAKTAAEVMTARMGFWLGFTPKAATAAQLDKLYAARVQFANHNFSTYKLGWKTDMGKVYVLFGPPQSLTLRANEQIWFYSRTPAPTTSGLYNDPESLQFHFRRLGGGAEPTRWALERLGEYDPFVQACLTAWRTGTVLQYLSKDEQRLLKP